MFFRYAARITEKQTLVYRFFKWKQKDLIINANLSVIHIQ